MSIRIRKDFYVYLWVNCLTGEVFYVGKGQGSRYRDTSKRSDYFKRYLNKYHCYVEKIYENLTEQQAFYLEIQTIAEFKEIGQARCNLALGGEGSVGYKHTKEQRKRTSESKLGDKNPMYGKTLSEEVRKKLSEANRGSKSPCSIPVAQIDKTTNTVIMIFSSSWEAERVTGFNHSNITNCIKGKLKTVGKLPNGNKCTWRYATEEEILNYKQ